MKTKEDVIASLNSPIFIVGCPRSGTTWLHRLLISHSDVMGGPESDFFVGFKGAFTNLGDSQDGTRNVGMLLDYWEKDQLILKMHELWVETFSGFVSRGEGRVFCEKSPSHALHIDSIIQLLPQAKIIHIIRDSRSTTASMLAASKGWGSNWAPSTAKSAAIQWYLHVMNARKSGSNLASDKYIEVYYEDLKRNTPECLERLFDFIGVKYDEKMLHSIVNEQDFKTQKAIGGSALSPNSKEKEPEGFFRKGQVDSWKKDLSLIEKITVWRYTRKLMKEVGYVWAGRK